MNDNVSSVLQFGQKTINSGVSIDVWTIVLFEVSGFNFSANAITTGTLQKMIYRDILEGRGWNSHKIRAEKVTKI